MTFYVGEASTNHTV